MNISAMVRNNYDLITSLRHQGMCWKEVLVYLGWDTNKMTIQVAYNTLARERGAEQLGRRAKSIATYDIDEITARREKGESWAKIAKSYKVATDSVSQSYYRLWDYKYPAVEITLEEMREYRSKYLTARKVAIMRKCNVACVHDAEELYSIKLGSALDEDAEKILAVSKAKKPMELAKEAGITYNMARNFMRRSKTMVEEYSDSAKRKEKKESKEPLLIDGVKRKVSTINPVLLSIHSSKTVRLRA